MRSIALVLFVTVAGVGVGVPLSAHHSFAAYYAEEQSVTIEGNLVEFEYRSPHAWVHVMAPDQNGVLQKFSAEWAGAPRLAQRGVTAETLKPGDRLIITGAPGRNAADRRIHLKSIERPADGWAWRGGGQRR